MQTRIDEKEGSEPTRSSFSYGELEKLLQEHGFLIYELLAPEDIQRDIIDKGWADLKAFEHVNYCLAINPYFHSFEYHPVSCRLEPRGVNSGITGERWQNDKKASVLTRERRLDYRIYLPMSLAALP